MSYRTIATSKQVIDEIQRQHRPLVLFDTFSDPEGGFMGDRDRGTMETSYAINGTDYPIIKFCTTWVNDPEKPFERIDELTTYWLCIGVENN